MLKEYLKQELIEDPKVKPILEKHADRILNILNQEVISYGDFRRLAKVIFNKENASEKCSYTEERELQKLYDEYRLFKRFFSNEERAEKLVRALRDLSNKKSFQVDTNPEL